MSNPRSGATEPDQARRDQAQDDHAQDDRAREESRPNFATRALRTVDRFQQSHPSVAFGYGVVKKYGDDNGGQLAKSLTYTGFVTLFPLLLVLTTILGLVASIDPSIRHRVNSAVAGQFPLIGDNLTQNVSALHRSSLIGLIVGLLVVIWGTSGLAETAMFTMAQVWNIPGPDRPKYLHRLSRAGLFLLVLLVGVIATTGLASLSAFGHHSPALLVAADALAVIVNVAMYMLGFRVLTPKSVAVRDLLPGAVLAGVLWTVLQAGGALVVTHFLNSESVYHIFAIVLALIAWIYLVVQLTIYAAEVNVVRARKLYPRSLTNPPLTRADRAALALQPLQNQRVKQQRVEVTFTDQAGEPGDSPDK
jgi:YihY family inner membrane protein